MSKPRELHSNKIPEKLNIRRCFAKEVNMDKPGIFMLLLIRIYLIYWLKNIIMALEKVAKENLKRHAV